MNDPSVAELARQVRDVLERFKSLADRLDTAYVSKEVFRLHQDLMAERLHTLRTDIDKKASKAISDDIKDLKEKKADKSAVDDLKGDVEGLLDDRKWLIRIVLTFVILAILGVVFAANGVSK